MEMLYTTTRRGNTFTINGIGHMTKIPRAVPV